MDKLISLWRRKLKETTYESLNSLLNEFEEK